MPSTCVRPLSGDTERGQALFFDRDNQSKGTEKEDEEKSRIKTPKGDRVCCDCDDCTFCHRRIGLGNMSPMQRTKVFMFLLQWNRTNEMHGL